MQIAADEGFLQFRPAPEPHRFEDPVPLYLIVDEVGDGTGEVSGDRQEADPEPAGALARIQPQLQTGDGRQKAAEANQECIAESHKWSLVFEAAYRASVPSVNPTMGLAVFQFHFFIIRFFHFTSPLGSSVSMSHSRCATRWYGFA